MKNVRTPLMVLALTLMIVSFSWGSENILKKGGYANRSVWIPKMISPKTKKLGNAPDILSVEKKDLPKKEITSALSVSIKKPTLKDISHVSGVHVMFNKSVPKNAVVKVSFWAKRLSGAKIISLRRSWGASGAGLAMLSDKWEKYDVEIEKWAAAGSGICISLVKQNLQGLQLLAEGHFLIADVVIEELPKDKKSE